ncbi:MAG: zinc ABC transporter substrate-binding protein [Candidatus Bathyarchaeia archaeon]
MLRRRKVIAAVVVLVLLFIIAGLNTSVASIDQKIGSSPVRIIVSIEMLKMIISPILSGVGEVHSIISGEVEPHSFTLTPEIIENVSKADLIVITGHIEWEEELIKGVAETKGVGADQISINLLKLNEIRILDLNGERNLHGFWLLPDNALIIAREVKEKISKIRPDLSQKVTENYEEFERRVISLKNFLNGLSDKYGGVRGKSIVIGFYTEQYVAETIGLRVSSVLISEEGNVRPEMIRSIYEGLKSGEYACVIISDAALLIENVKRALEEIYEKTSCPVAYILTVSPNSLESYDAVMYYNAGQIYSALLARRSLGLGSSDIYPFIIASLLAVVAFETVLLFRRRD